MNKQEANNLMMYSQPSFIAIFIVVIVFIPLHLIFAPLASKQGESKNVIR